MTARLAEAVERLFDLRPPIPIAADAPATKEMLRRRQGRQERRGRVGAARRVERLELRLSESDACEDFSSLDLVYG